jgi:glycosyltransferase involved in cell wall biosynthesis
MLDLRGSVRPALLLAKELVSRKFDVSMLSAAMTTDVERALEDLNIEPVNAHAKLLTKKYGLSLVWFETWLRESLLKLNSRSIHLDSYTVINFSHTFLIPSLVWYVQGPPSDALRDMEPEFPMSYKFAYKALKRPIEYADRKFIERMAKQSKFVVANSKFCASLYEKRGVHIHDIIYPPIECRFFKPTTSKPSADYVLAYLGKETKFSAIKQIADEGVKIKAFGFKASYIPNALLHHRNIDYLWNIPDEELAEAYSNALYTLFPFTHEPFGYVPIESMSCGTPAITYNMQGPSEYIANGRTGWLANNYEQLVKTVLEVWKNGYPSQMRSSCREYALRFDKDIFAKKWLGLLNEII